MKYIQFIFLFIIISEWTHSELLQIDRRQYYSYGHRLIAEAYYNDIQGTDSINLQVLFRIQYNAMEFVLDSESQYKADVSIEVECRDNEGIIRRRAYWNKVFMVNSYEATQSKTDYLKGLIKTNLLAGNYLIKVRLISNNAARNITLDLPLTYQKIKNQCLPDSMLTMLQYTPDNKLIPPILGRKVSFTSNRNVLLVKYCSRVPIETILYYNIKKLKSDKNIFDWDVDVNLTGRVDFLKNKELSFEDVDGEIFAFLKDIQNEDSTLILGLLKIEIPPDRLYPGLFQLDLFKSGGLDTLKFNFEVIWDMMPLSLMRVDYAVKAAYYIMTDEEYNSINSGSEREKLRKLMSFWTKHDPTPGTPFNEAMAEYYKRVDFAYFNYQTITEKDGAMTDRGKIYILYGPPTKTVRDLSPSKTREIWYYQNIKKQFVFELLSVGNYRLIEINDV